MRSSAAAKGRAPGTARALALRVIRRVTEEGAFSGVMLAAELSGSKLSARDRQFAADLLYGTLRRRIPIDRVIEGASSRPLEAVDPPALALLRMGAYQLLFTRVPSHAAVSETVALAPPSSRGFVNAVLRKVSSSPPPEPPVGDDDRAVSLRTGLAEWAVRELRRLLPDPEVETAAVALATPAALSLRANRCRTTPDMLGARLEEAGHPVTRAAHNQDVLSIGTAAPALLPGYEEGWFTVQDEASAVIASALGVGPGELVLDACAAPGGKATHLACLASGGLVVAADVRLARAQLVRRAASRLGAPLAVLVQDARRPALREGFDAILVDAPCSGVGAARRRPELLWRREKGELSRLARLQVGILMGVADLLRPGGRLVYSVCTFPRAETDAVVRAFLAKRADFEPMAIPGPDGPAPSHRLWPHRHGTDAMFYAGLRRRR